MNIIDTVPELTFLFSGADHVDVKKAESGVTLREFVAGSMSWSPVWVKVLFLARTVLARLLRLDDSHLPAGVRPRPEEISFTPGDRVGLFTVTAAAEDRFIVLEAADNHLIGYLAIAAAPAAGGRTRFEAATVVKYRRWTGPLYFTIIRPFHHLVVRGMIKAGART